MFSTEMLEGKQFSSYDLELSLVFLCWDDGCAAELR